MDLPASVPSAVRVRPTRVLIPCLLFLLGTGGCAAVTLDAAGTLIGAAGTAAQTGSEVYHFGKLDFSVMATFDESSDAALAAVSDLQLHHDTTEFADKEKNEIVYKLHDRKRKIDIRIDRRTERLCQCRVDVGIFGSEPTAKLIMERMRYYLGKSKVGESPRKTVAPL